MLAPTTTLNVANLQPATTYCFKVQTESAGGQSALSVAARAKTHIFGLEGYWKLNEGSGTTARDSSGDARDGTLVGGVTYSTDKPDLDNDPFTVSSSGAAGTAVSVPDASVWWFTGSYTLSMWAKVTAAPTGTASGSPASAPPTAARSTGSYPRMVAASRSQPDEHRSPGRA